ncbi:phage tail sheath family protein [Phosphitispora fastidiosa]|uniref:phage tail sheath family protein n=1 Tax=Phosphitispora fastidiosa TaxID=2837202 RepID=UPI001E54AAD2|nr:phage tail sheath family protein [Phosphitispora fastidiosa]MBU7005781.1 phage tail sheath protein FI [Phosphitispora fastidiosa]
MPEYLSPGVYVEEIEIGAKPVAGVSTSTAGFLGETERGPAIPRLVTSWLDYQRVFGGYFGADKYLPYSVQGFFDNGGQRCFIGRIVKTGAGTASFKLKQGTANALTVAAVGEGSWGTRIAVKATAGTFSGFKLSLFYWKDVPVSLYDPDNDLTAKPRPAVTEVFDNLSVVEASADYYTKRVNGISNLITVTKQSGDSGAVPDVLAVTWLAGGDDGTGPLVLADYTRTDTNEPGKRKGLSGFSEVDEISLVYSPNAQAVNGLVGAVITHCENLKDRFALIDAAQGSAGVASLDPRSDNETKYAAFYYPWLRVVDPVAGMRRLVPPGGHMAGIYARTDAERGVHKAPANEVVRGAVDLEFQITKGEQDILNPRGVNCIRFFPGRGIRIWGARTLSSDTLWKYINVRRLFIYLEESIDEGTQWVVFEPNNEKLWARVRRTLTEFLTRVWRDGALMGTKPEEAFFVKVDRTTMTQDDIDNGRLIVLIGVAPVKPAEFVIFRIAQFAGGSDVSEG